MSVSTNTVAVTDSSDNNSWWNYFKNKCYDAYNGLLYYANPFGNISAYEQSQAQVDAKNLSNLRDKHFSTINNSNHNDDFAGIARNISSDTKQYISTLIQEEIQKKGKPPCEFSVFTLGSLAREESGPVTDLEIGFLIDKKTAANYKYFSELSQSLSDRIFLLGEHPDIGGKGLRMDEANNSPIHKRFFARNIKNQDLAKIQKSAVQNRDFDKIPFEGSRPFICTKEELASFTAPDFINQPSKSYNKRDPKIKSTKDAKFWDDQCNKPFSAREKTIANDLGKKLGRNIDLIYGSKTIFNNFKQLKAKQLDKKLSNGLTNRQNIAYQSMVDDINKHLEKSDDNIFITGKLGKKLDIKRELYRFGEQFVTNLGFFYNCKSQNCHKIISELEQKQIITMPQAEKLKDHLNFANYLRLKQQATLKRQGFAVYLDPKKHQDDLEDLNKKINDLKNSVAYLKQIGSPNKEILAQKERELIKSTTKLEHLKQMAPGIIINKDDQRLLEDKYAPLAKGLFQFAQNWTKHVANMANNNCEVTKQQRQVTSMFDLKKSRTKFAPKPALANKKAKRKKF